VSAPYFQLSVEQRQHVAEHVRGSIVHDLGCGPLMPALRFLAESGALVHCVDKEPAEEAMLKLARESAAMGYHQCLFENYKPTKIEVAFVSWPANHHMPGLMRLLKMAHTIVYVGQNTDYSACGFREMFTHFTTRPLLAHVPHPKNTLLVLGPHTPGYERDPVLEEWAALDQTRVYFFDGSTPADKEGG
jgi:hypothetical protein